MQFIRYLLGRDFPGQRIGPEPTTDRFVAVMDGADERVIPGNALTVSPNLPYRGLDRFGVAFLNKFEASQLPSPVLRNITIVDTPGALRWPLELALRDTPLRRSSGGRVSLVGPKESSCRPCVGCLRRPKARRAWRCVIVSCCVQGRRLFRGER